MQGAINFNCIKNKLKTVENKFMEHYRKHNMISDVKVCIIKTKIKIINQFKDDV